MLEHWWTNTVTIVRLKHTVVFTVVFSPSFIEQNLSCMKSSALLKQRFTSRMIGHHWLSQYLMDFCPTMEVNGEHQLSRQQHFPEESLDLCADQKKERKSHFQLWIKWRVCQWFLLLEVHFNSQCFLLHPQQLIKERLVNQRSKMRIKSTMKQSPCPLILLPEPMSRRRIQSLILRSLVLGKSRRNQPVISLMIQWLTPPSAEELNVCRRRKRAFRNKHQHKQAEITAASLQHFRSTSFPQMRSFRTLVWRIGEISSRTNTAGIFLHWKEDKAAVLKERKKEREQRNRLCLWRKEKTAVGELQHCLFVFMFCIRSLSISVSQLLLQIWASN